MPFDPTRNYESDFTEISHSSVPANGRGPVTADFAVVYINGHTIGLVQHFSPTESRPVSPQYELGNLYPAEFIPQPWQGNIQVGRLEIFKNQLYKAFGFNDGIATYGLAPYWPSNKMVNGKPVVTSLADIQWPIDISLHINNPPSDGTVTVKNYIECWITQSGSSYDAGSKIVTENVSFTFRTTTMDSVDLSSLVSSGLFNTAV